MVRSTIAATIIAARFCLLVVCLRVGKSNCQETNSFDAPSYTPGVNRKTNFCSLHRLTETGEVQLKDILRGKNITVGLFKYQLENIDGTYRIPSERPGAGIRFLDELAERGGFTWRDSFGILDSPKKELNQTWTGLLRWSVDSYDLVGDWYMETLERLSESIVFPQGWYDGSLIMVMKKPAHTENSNLWAFLEPFAPSLWYSILALTVFSGMIMYLLEYIKCGLSKENMQLSLIDNLYVSFIGSTGHIIHTPRNMSSQIMVFSTACVSIFMLSSYTANLASFLIYRNAPTVTINDIADAVKADLSFCVMSSSTSQKYMDDMYEVARTVERDTISATYESVLNGECDIVLTTKGTWAKNELDPKVNKDCSLVWVGRVVSSYSAGFSLRDTSAHCSSLLRDVLSYHMIEMKLQKRDEVIWNRVLRKATNNYDCAVQDMNGSNDLSKLQLNLDHLRGVFCIPLIGTVLAVALSIYSYYTDYSSLSGRTPAGGTPAGGTPAGGTPAGGTPTGGTPAGRTPAGGTPAGGTPNKISGFQTCAISKPEETDTASSQIIASPPPIVSGTSTTMMVNQEEPNNQEGSDTAARSSISSVISRSFSILRESVVVPDSALVTDNKTEAEYREEDSIVIGIMITALVLLWGCFFLLLYVGK